MSQDPGQMASEIADLAMQLHQQPTLEETVDTLLAFSTNALGCAYAGVIFVHRGKTVETIAATSDVVATLAAIEMEAGEGPDIDIREERRAVYVDDVTNETRWPHWAALVAPTGIRSIVGIPLYTSSTLLGSINFYDPRPGHFDMSDRQVAHVLARHAAIALDHVQSSENLRKAIDGRKLIGQAQGMLMERFSIDADQAFAVLMRYSQSHNVKLARVAEQLVVTRALPSAPQERVEAEPREQGEATELSTVGG